MLQDLRIEKEDLQALLSEMEKCGFVATTLHEIRTFTIAQRRTPRVPDEAVCAPEIHALPGEETIGDCLFCGKPLRR
mgnify:FL=1